MISRGSQRRQQESTTSIQRPLGSAEKLFFFDHSEYFRIFPNVSEPTNIFSEPVVNPAALSPCHNLRNVLRVITFEYPRH